MFLKKKKRKSSPSRLLTDKNLAHLLGFFWNLGEDLGVLKVK